MITSAMRPLMPNLVFVCVPIYVKLSPLPSPGVYYYLSYLLFDVFVTNLAALRMMDEFIRF